MTENINPFITKKEKSKKIKTTGATLGGFVLMCMNFIEIVFIIMCYSENSHKDPVDNCICAGPINDTVMNFALYH